MTDQTQAMVEIRGLDKHFGPETAVKGVDLAVASGEFVTLLGPSGCGKTTTLRCIAGLERPDAGSIRIGGDLVASAEDGFYLYPEDRNIGMVFQSYAVWPHMTVFDNVAYGLRVRKVGSAELKSKTMRGLELVGLDHLAERYATKLSGGQRQRVALARAIVYEPKVVLFDEPLSNLDAKLREQMRIEIVRLQREVGITSIFVTHDQSEALVMSDRVVVMDKAVIQQIGGPQEIYAEPTNSFVANFIGVATLMNGKLKGREGDICQLEIPVGEGQPPLQLRAVGAKGASAGQDIILSLRPEDIELQLSKPQNGAAENLMTGQVIDTVYLGSFLECRVQVGIHEVGIQIDHFEQLDPGQTVYLSFKPEHGLTLTE
ncbi:MAG: ABC transporter ATP-binding protein [Methyloligellaceae bacterium]